MLIKIEKFLFDRSFKRQRKIIIEFCESATESLIDLVYVSGDTATGKTTILNIIQTELLIKDNNLKIKFTTAESLVQHFLQFLNEKKVDEFTSYYLQYDILLIDDYESLDDRPQTTEVFAHIFRNLIIENKKIVISCTGIEGYVSLFWKLCDKQIKLIDLNQNKFNIDKLVKMKSKQFGLKKIVDSPKFQDIREIEGFLKTEKFLQTMSI